MAVTVVLVICRNANFRKLYVDNLVIRGYVAVGVASAAESRRLLRSITPDVVVFCCDISQVEPDIQALRSRDDLKRTPMFLISPDRPDSDWMDRWRIDRHIPYRVDVREVVATLEAWL